MRPTDAALVLGATMRLTRFVVVDDLGQWTIRDPIDKVLHEHESLTPYHKYQAMLVCPWCVGTHVGWLVLGSYVLTGRSKRARGAWRFGAGVLTLNYVAAHLGIRLGDVSSD